MTDTYTRALSEAMERTAEERAKEREELLHEAMRIAAAHSQAVVPHPALAWARCRQCGGDGEYWPEDKIEHAPTCLLARYRALYPHTEAGQ